MSALATGSFVQVSGSGFTLDGKPWHPIGVNYWPHYSQPYWRDSRYDWVTLWNNPAFPSIQAEAEIRSDFERMHSHGINEIRLEPAYAYTLASLDPAAPTPANPSQTYCNALRTLLDIAGENSIKVTLIMGADHGQWAMKPNAFQIASSSSTAAEYVSYMGRLIDSCHLADHEAILAYDIDLESSVDFVNVPAGWSRTIYSEEAVNLWNQWLVSQYGSGDLAAWRWGYAPPRECLANPGCPSSNPTTCATPGRYCPPPDSQLTSDGPGAKAAKAFRRFVADVINKRFQRLTDLLRAKDGNHLLTTDSGVDDFCHQGFNFVARDTTKYLDFAEPHIYHFQHPNFVANVAMPQDLKLRDSAATVAFLNPSRRPIVMGEFGMTVKDCREPYLARNPTCVAKDLLQVQTNLYPFDSQIFKAGGAAGERWWWWRGERPMGGLSDGPADKESTDFGMISPVGADRQVLTAVAFGPPIFSPDRPERTASVDLLTSVCPNKIAEAAYPAAEAAVAANQKLTIVTQCSWADSTTAPLTCADGTNYWLPAPLCDPKDQHCCPLLCLSAMFDRVEVLDATGNWHRAESGDTVVVTPGKVRVRVKVGNTGESAWRASTAGHVGQVRISLEGSGLSTTRVDLPADVPSFGSTTPLEFEAYSALSGPQTLTLRIVDEERAFFGEIYTLHLTTH